MDIEKAFAFPFEDTEWTSKLGLGAAISLVPILNFAWSGYMVGIIRNVMNAVPEPLPTWDDLNRKFMDGLVLFAAGMIYALPMLIFICLPLGAVAFSGILADNSGMEEVARSIAGAGGILLTCFLCAFGLYGLALSFLHPVILVMFAREGTFASCFKLGEAFNLISRNAAAFLTAWGLGLVAGLVVGLLVGFVNVVVGWIPIIGWTIGMVLGMSSVIYSNVVYAHLFGQFGKAALGSTRLAIVA